MTTKDAAEKLSKLSDEVKCTFFSWICNGVQKNLPVETTAVKTLCPKIFERICSELLEEAF